MINDERWCKINGQNDKIEITAEDLLGELKELCRHIEHVRYVLSCNRCGPSDLYNMEQAHYKAQQIIKRYYEKHLNEIGSPDHPDHPDDYGTWLRHNNPNAFQTGYIDFMN